MVYIYIYTHKCACVFIQNTNEITLTQAGWAWKVQNFIFCYFWQLKIHRTHKHTHSNLCHGLNFHRKLIFFLILVTMSSIRINNNWNYQKMLITASTTPILRYWNTTAVSHIVNYLITWCCGHMSSMVSYALHIIVFGFVWWNRFSTVWCI